MTEARGPASGTESIPRSERRHLRRLAGRALAAVSHRWEMWTTGKDNWWFGKVVELRGDRMTVDGCTFEVGSAAIDTRAKGTMLFGRYERPERDALRYFLEPEVPVVEFGGAVGVVSCLTNLRLADRARHVVVEANPALVPLLTRNREANGCGFTVVNAAVAYSGETISFFQYRNYLGSRVAVGSEGTVTVPSTTLGRLLGEHRFRECTLICDIEGAELEMVREEIDVLGGCVRTLIVELHPHFYGGAGAAEIEAALESRGFRRVWNAGDTHVYRNTRLIGAMGSTT